MADIIRYGTPGNDQWTIINPGRYTVDGLAGVDSIDFGTSLLSEYSITSSGSTVYVDSVSGASGDLHATLFNIEILVFGNKSEKLDLRVFFGDIIAPTVLDYKPVMNAQDVPVNSEITFHFSETIVRGSGNITLLSSDGKPFQVFTPDSLDVKISGATLILHPARNFDFGSEYSISFDANSVMDLAGNPFEYDYDYGFRTVFSSVVNGTAGDDQIKGTAGNDQIFSGDGNDMIQASSGNDLLDGGNGQDVVVFQDKLSAYMISHSDAGFLALNKAGGSERLKYIESLKFSDLTVNLTITALAAQSAEENVTRLMELYVAFFNRIPDADGLAYWIKEMQHGSGINQIAESFYSAGVEYSGLTGFTKDMSNSDFVGLIYKTVLGRTDGGDAAGVKYWSDQLSNKLASHGSLVSTMLDAAHGFKNDTTWGWVADLLDNKIAVAHSFAIEWGLGYASPEEAITHGMEIARAVTATDTIAAMQLIGIPGGDIFLG